MTAENNCRVLVQKKAIDSTLMLVKFQYEKSFSNRGLSERHFGFRAAGVQEHSDSGN